MKEYAQKEPGKVKSNGPKICQTSATLKGARGVIRTYPWEEGGDPGLQEQCRQVMHQLNAITAVPSPVKPLPSKPEARKRELEPSAALVLTTSSWQWISVGWGSMSEGDWYQLTLRAHHHRIPGPEGHAGRSAPGGGWAAPPCLSCLTPRGNGRNWKSSSIYCYCLQPLPSLGVAVCSPTPPTTLEKLCILLEAIGSNPQRYFYSSLLSVRTGHVVCYVCMDSNFVTDPIGKMSCLANSIWQLKGGVQNGQERQLEQTEDGLFDLAEQVMALVQTMKCSPEEEQRLAILQEWEDQLMTRAEDLWKRIAKALQGIGIPESVPKGSEEATKWMGQHQALGREVSLPLSSPPQATASTSVVAGSEPIPSWSTP